MFPLDFPLGALNGAPAGTAVLDPFCGRGTTLYAARLLGLQADGVDVNPVAAAIASAKLAQATPEAVLRRAARLIADYREITDPPESEFWSLAFAKSTLTDLAALRRGLRNTRNDDVAKLLRALTLGMLHGPRNKGRASYLSNQMPRTFATKPGAAVRFWRARRLEPPLVDLLDLLDRRAKYILARPPKPSGGKVRQGDARRVLGGHRQYDLVVTSPPYPGMRTYGPDQWLRGWFVGGPPEPEYKAGGGLASTDLSEFTRALAEVWGSVARACVPGARMVVRFGAVPSIKADAETVLRDSIEMAAAGWSLVSTARTPPPPRSRRQAEQFQSNVGDAADEIDAVYRLAI